MRKSVAIGFAALATLAAQADTYWRDKQGGPFNDVARWKVGDDEVTAVAATTCPGENDYIHAQTSEDGYMAFSFDGDQYKVRGIVGPYTGSGYHALDLYRPSAAAQPGSLEFTETFLSHRHTINVHGGTRLTFGPACATTFDWGGAINTVQTTEANAEIDLNGPVTVNSALHLSNAAGATMAIGAPTWTFGAAAELWDANCNQTFVNGGMMTFSGLAFARSGDCWYTNNVIRFQQNGGTMTFDGAFVSECPTTGAKIDRFFFELNGGALDVNADVDMTFMETVGMPTANSSATIDIAAGCTLDWSNATFAEGTTLTVTGDGTLVLGAGAPTTLNIAGLANLKIAKAMAFQTVTGYANTAVAVDLTGLTASRNSFRVTGGDAGFRAKVAEGITDVPEGWTKETTDDAVVVHVSESLTYYGQDYGWARFSQASSWRVGDNRDVPAMCPGDYDYLSCYNDTPHPQWPYLKAERRLLLDGNFQVKGLAGEYTTYDWFTFEVCGYYLPTGVSQGSLEFTDSFTSRGHTIEVSQNARLVFGKNCTTTFGWGGAYNTIRTASTNSEIDFYGPMSVDTSVHFTNTVDNTMSFGNLTWTFCNGAQRWNDNVNNEQTFDNCGKMTFAGQTFKRDAAVTWSYDNIIRFRQNGGTMTFDGAFVSECPTSGEHHDRFFFELNGGALDVNADVDMTFMETVGMPTANSSATIDIAAGCTLDWSNATFAEGTTLTVTGDGTLVLGASMPTTLTVKNLKIAGAMTLPVVRDDSGALVAQKTLNVSGTVTRTAEGALTPVLTAGPFKGTDKVVIGSCAGASLAEDAFSDRWHVNANAAASGILQLDCKMHGGIIIFR